MEIFSVLLASTSKEYSLYSWSTPVIFIVIAEALPRASEGSGYEGTILLSHLVLLTLVNGIMALGGKDVIRRQLQLDLLLALKPSMRPTCCPHSSVTCIAVLGPHLNSHPISS